MKVTNFCEYADVGYMEVGDWISFQRDNGISIGEIRYIFTETGGRAKAVTDCGTVDVQSVLEVRRLG